jgi:rhodanese-related sulfurtransferase
MAVELDIGPDTTMEEILRAYPSAKVGLFQRYHIGGCASCGYQPTDTLAKVCEEHDIKDPLDQVVACIRQSHGVEAQLHISPAAVRAALRRGDRLRLLDVRTPAEFKAGHIEDAQHVTVELTFEILDSWPKDEPLALYSNRGRRSLDKASYFRAYGLTNVKSIDGGMEAWAAAIESCQPRPVQPAGVAAERK